MWLYLQSNEGGWQKHVIKRCSKDIVIPDTVWILKVNTREKRPLLFLAEGREKEPFWDSQQHSVLKRVWAQEKRFNQSLTDLEEEYPTPVYCSHTVLPKKVKKNWEACVKSMVQRYRLYRKPTTNIILIGDKLKVFQLRPSMDDKKVWMPPLTTAFQYHIGSPS